jgi:hypothetical protein
MATRTEWSERVAAWRSSGQSAEDFCRGREYTAKKLHWWCWHLRQAGKQKSLRGAGVGLARVVRKPPEPSPLAAGSVLVVHLGEARVEVGPGADSASIAAVFGALSSWTGAVR